MTVEIPTVGIGTGALDMVPSTRARNWPPSESHGYGAVWIPEVAGRDPFVHLSLLSATDRLVGPTGRATADGPTGERPSRRALRA